MTNLGYDPTGRWLFATDHEHAPTTKYVFDLTAPPGAEPRVLARGEPVVWYFPLAFDPTGRWAATIHTNEIAFWPLESPSAHVLSVPSLSAQAVAFAPDGRSLLWLALDAGVRTLSLRGDLGGTRTVLPASPPFGLLSMTMHGASRALALSGGRGRLIVVPLDGGPARALRGFPEETGAVGKPAFQRRRQARGGRPRLARSARPEGDPSMGPGDGRGPGIRSAAGRRRRLGRCHPGRVVRRARPVARHRVGDNWRPVTAIQTGDTDGNPDTVGDPTWTSFRPTPPNQEYASGHAIEGGAGAEVLKQFFGTDEIGFRDCSATLPAGSTCSDATPVFRAYTSFSQAAVENGYSRILIGYHFRKSVEEGTDYGRKIGKRAANLYLRPVH